MRSEGRQAGDGRRCFFKARRRCLAGGPAVRASVKDFLMGTIRATTFPLLKEFIAAFGISDR
jgi:hypothetical protein